MNEPRHRLWRPIFQRCTPFRVTLKNSTGPHVVGPFSVLNLGPLDKRGEGAIARDLTVFALLDLVPGEGAGTRIELRTVASRLHSEQVGSAFKTLASPAANALYIEEVVPMGPDNCFSVVVFEAGLPAEVVRTVFIGAVSIAFPDMRAPRDDINR